MADGIYDENIGGSAMIIRATLAADIPAIVELSRQKRLSYEKAQTQFWRYAGADAEISQSTWFAELLNSSDYIMLTALHQDKMAGFIIGRLVLAPEVYNPGGLNLMIDDFCVADASLWPLL
jgi:hypothetical protein